MFTRCTACHARLGTNDVLEPFPVGRRLAFDAATGRLWVLCTACRAWNLAPIEERWEAVETAERLFEGAVVGASTENVALGRLRDGTELVRVGRVERPELAAWRYGKRLLRRFWGNQVVGGVQGGIIGAAGFTALGPLGAMAVFGAAAVTVLAVRDRRPLTRTDDGVVVRRGDATGALMLPSDSVHGWLLEMPRRGQDPIVVEGSEAVRILRRILPRVTAGKARPRVIRNAVSEVERLGTPERVLREAATDLGDMDNMDQVDAWSRLHARPHRIATGHPTLCLALEIAANEETERRALDGELGLIEREWREAQELARITDDLLMPTAIAARLRELRGAVDT